MKKNEVKFNIFNNGQPIIESLATIQGRCGDETFLSGGITHNGKFCGVAIWKTNVIPEQSRKPKSRRKMYASVLAHRLAVDCFTRGKSGIADSMVMDLLSISDSSHMRKARREYAPDLPKGQELYIVGDSLKTSGIAILENPENLKVYGDSLDYAGKGVAWCGEWDDIILGELYINGRFDSNRLVADFSGKKLAPEI